MELKIATSQFSELQLSMHFAQNKKSNKKIASCFKKGMLLAHIGKMN